MLYDHDKKKGVKDTEFGTRRVYLHKDTTYSWMMDKMRDYKYLFPSHPSGAEYYVGDKIGQPL